MIKRIWLSIVMYLFASSLYAQIPRIQFTENKNQWPSNVLYRAALYDGYVYAEKNCLTYYFYESMKHSHAHGTQQPNLSIDSINKELQNLKLGIQPVINPIHEDFNNHDDTIHKSHSYKVYFKNMSSKSKLYAQNPLPGYENYFKGSDKSKWASKVLQYSKIKYSNIYNDIELELYDNNGTLKYDFIVNKGGNPKKIELEYVGTNRMEINSSGSLVIYTSINQIHELKPYAFQIINSDTIEVPCNYILNKNVVSYNVSNYNKSYPLYIDPQLIFSTYTGSFADNWGFTATYDFNNNVYAGGIVDAFGYPVSIGAIQSVYQGGNWDIGIIKYDPTGANRLYATYLGGNSSEMPHSLIVNKSNELLLLGTTGSDNFPMNASYDPSFNGGKNTLYDNDVLFENGIDIILAKLSEDGTQLLSSTYLGGTSNDGINYDWEFDLYYGHDSLYHNYGDGARGEIMVDENDNIYIASTTFSNDFPILSPLQATYGGMQDGIISKFGTDFSTLSWSTYIGGASKDAAYSIDVDKNGNAFVTGGTCSNTLGVPVNGFINGRIGGTVDAFVLSINQVSGALQNATYFGSSVYDQAYFVRTNNDGNVFIFGQTDASGSTLVFNANYSTPNSGQFLASFSNDLQTLNWSTVFGSGNGRPNISPTAFEVDICNRIYLAGAGRDWATGPSTGWYFDTRLGYWRRDDYGWRSVQGTKNMDITADAFQSFTDGQDFYIFVIDDEANNLDYATYFGELNYGGVVSYDGVTGTVIPCTYSGHDHVDGGTSRFDSKGFIYQSVCASCGGCNGFPISPVPNVWSQNNNSTNCNNAVMRFFIDFGLLIADFELPEIGCQTKDLKFTNTTQIYYTNPQIEYTWDFGDGSPISNDFEPTHVYSSPGDYIVKLWVKDSSACNLADSIAKVLRIVNDIKYDSIPAKDICEGDTTQIGIPQPFDSTLTYVWTPNFNIEDNNMPQTNAWPDTTTIYTLSVSQGWCETVYTQPVNVYNNTYGITDISVTQNGFPKNPICRGTSAILRANTSAPSQRYIWSTSRNFWPILNADFSQNSIIVNPTETTTYYLHTLSRSCGFEDIDSVTLTISFNEIITAGDSLICKNSIIPIYVTNLTPEFPVTYEWSPTYAIEMGENTDAPFVNPSTTTDFIVVATNIDGCSVQDTVHIEVDELIIDTYVNNPISCHGDNNAEIFVAPIGIEPYQYEWLDTVFTPSRSNLGPGTYTIFVIDSLGCENTRDFIIIDPAPLEIADTSISCVTCENACNGSISSSVIGGTSPYFYNWNTGETTSSIHNLCQGHYFLSIRDSHGCTNALTNSAYVGIVERLPYLHAYAEDNTLFKGQSTLLFAAEVISDTIEYQWIPAIWLESYNSGIVKSTPEDNITYYIRAKDRFGCTSIDTVDITVSDWKCEYPFIYVPTAFSPNNDGNNDVLQVESGVITDIMFSVYDRWGEKVFETTNINDQWDGTYNNKPLPPQVLVYHIQATCINTQTFNQKGNITIIK